MGQTWLERIESKFPLILKEKEKIEKLFGIYFNFIFSKRKAKINGIERKKKKRKTTQQLSHFPSLIANLPTISSNIFICSASPLHLYGP